MFPEIIAVVGGVAGLGTSIYGVVANVKAEKEQRRIEAKQDAQYADQIRDAKHEAHMYKQGRLGTYRTERAGSALRAVKLGKEHGIDTRYY